MEWEEIQVNHVWMLDYVYVLVWSNDNGTEEKYGGFGYFWLPQPSEGYVSVGFLVTDTPSKPKLDEVRCVRADLTDKCESYRLLLYSSSKFANIPFRVWSTRPCHWGMRGKGVSIGTFICTSYWSARDDLYIGCLKNLDPTLFAMPNLNQIHALVNLYGPTVFFQSERDLFAFFSFLVFQ